MAEKTLAGAALPLGIPERAHHEHKETSCIHTKKIYDACRDKDCIEDARVYLTRESQRAVDKAISVRCRDARLIWVFVDVEPVNFNKGFYTIDVKYFYRITAEAFFGVNRPAEVEGLATFDKRVILFGSEGNAKIYSSKTNLGTIDALAGANLPTAFVEVVDPICLGVKLVDKGNFGQYGLDDPLEVPDVVRETFGDELVIDGDGKRLFVSLGQFSIIRLERDTQLLVESTDFCIPDKECPCTIDDNPCDLFKRIRFPVDEFCPPDSGGYNP
ncbi:hypothetical protein FACS18949_09470 [Clostridia bacterium]|nr:hypothetical protein FACS18949_09470 [Clostridia bacterium]